MKVRTFTDFWNMEKKLYSLYDISLPVPISLRVLGVFVGVLIPWGALMLLFHVPFAPPIGYLVWLLPPGVLAWWGSRPIFEGKTIFAAARSRIGYLFQPKHFKGVRPDMDRGKTFDIKAHFFARLPQSQLYKQKKRKRSRR